MYRERNDESHQPWGREANELTGMVAPGFVVQASSTAPVELHVEVTYGRAYLAVDSQQFVTIVRDEIGNRDGGLFGSAPSSAGAEPAACLSPHGDLVDATDDARWPRSARLYGRVADSLPCVWELAERTARAMGADMVRVDVFVPQADAPGEECVLNGISLSSAMPYGPHDEWVAKLWVHPTLRRLANAHRMTGAAAATPVYRLVNLTGTALTAY